MPRPLPLVLALLALAVAAFPSAAAGSLKIAESARLASLKVTSTGAAQVTWRMPSGRWRTVVIRRDGSLRYGAKLKGRDVSRPVSGVAIPYRVTVRQTPNGRLWALQAWKRLRNRPVELHFSRWEGAPTVLKLWTVCCKWRSEVVKGLATYHGKPVYGCKATRTGVPLDKYGRNVYLDTFRYGRWRRMMGVLTHCGTGRFALWIRPHWRGRAYRGSIIGPNWGWTLAPDAKARAASSLL